MTARLREREIARASASTRSKDSQSVRALAFIHPRKSVLPPSRSSAAARRASSMTANSFSSFSRLSAFSRVEMTRSISSADTGSLGGTASCDQATALARKARVNSRRASMRESHSACQVPTLTAPVVKSKFLKCRQSEPVSSPARHAPSEPAASANTDPLRASRPVPGFQGSVPAESVGCPVYRSS